MAFQTIETLRRSGTEWLATTPPTLSERHRQKLEVGSKIDPAVIAERGYRTVSWQEAVTLGYSVAQTGKGDGLFIPRWTARGITEGHQLRSDSPRLDREGKPVKYESPKKQSNKLDTHPRCFRQLTDPRVDLWLTEGCGKLDALVSQGFCVIGLAGVWGWRYTDPITGGKVAVPCWDSVALNDRKVVLAFDADVMTKVSVAEALRRLSRFLMSKGAKIYQFDWASLVGVGGSSNGN